MRHKVSLKRTLGQVWLGVLLVILGAFFSAMGQAQPGETRVVINIPSTTLSVYAGETLIKSYRVGVGRAGFPTPLGKYRVIRKVVNPGWENPYLAPGRVQVEPGQDNPLGTRWIGFKESAGGEYGIHGTDMPSSVGKFSSHGCVRMRIPDAEDLFNRIAVGTPVEIQYELVSLRQAKDKVLLVTYPDVYRRGYPAPQILHTRIMAAYPGAVIQPTQLMGALKAPSYRPVQVAAIQSDAIPLEDKLAMASESDLVLKGGPKSLKGVQTDVPVNIAQAPTPEKPGKPLAPAKPTAVVPTKPSVEKAKAAVPKPAQSKPETPAQTTTEKPGKTEETSAPPAATAAPEKASQPLQPVEKPVADPPPLKPDPSIPFAKQIQEIQQKLPQVDIQSAVPNVPKESSTGLILILAVIGAFIVIRMMIMMTRQLSQVKAELQAMNSPPDHATVMAHEPMMLREASVSQNEESVVGWNEPKQSPYVQGQQVLNQTPMEPTIGVPDSLYDDEAELEANGGVDEAAEAQVSVADTVEESIDAEDEDWPDTDLDDGPSDAPVESVVVDDATGEEAPMEQPMPNVQPSQIGGESAFAPSLQRYLSLSQQQQRQV